MNKKILYVILGVVSIVLGAICFFDDNLAAALCGIGLLIYGIGGLVQWRERKKAGAAGPWALITAIVAVFFGIFILVGNQFEIFAAHILLLALSIWLIAQGVLEALSAIMYRKAMTSEDLGIQAPGSVSSMVLGIVMVIVGILGIIFPVVAGFILWIWIVVVLILSGIRLIWSARSAGALEGGVS